MDHVWGSDNPELPCPICGVVAVKHAAGDGDWMNDCPDPWHGHEEFSCTRCGADHRSLYAAARAVMDWYDSGNALVEPGPFEALRAELDG